MELSNLEIIFDDSKTDELAPRVLKEVNAARDELAEQAALIENINGEASNNIVVALLGTINGTLKAVEETRAKVKAPVIKRGKAIDKAAEDWTAPLVAQKRRLDDLKDGFQRKLLADKRAAEAQQAAELARVAKEEREARERLEAAQTPQEASAAQRELSNIAFKPIAVAPAPVKAQGQSVGTEWKADVLDINAVYKSAPHLFKPLEISPAALKAALSNGLRECPGLRIYEDVKTTVRSK